MDQNFLNFMQLFGKIWQICMLAPNPGGLVPPPTRNAGSGPVKKKYLLWDYPLKNDDLFFQNVAINC